MTPYSVKDELKAKGYSLLRAAALEIPDDLQQALLSLTIDYADLPSDEYLPGGEKFRFRRYGRFRFLPASCELQRLPHVDYFQSADIYRVTGGYLSKFAPLSESSFDNPFLQELIRFDFEQFPVAAEHNEAAWEVQIHLIRVTASAGLEGRPTPEGIHRDGAEFVTVHLAELVNAGGGDVSIYDDDKTLADHISVAAGHGQLFVSRCLIVAPGESDFSREPRASCNSQHLDLRLSFSAGFGLFHSFAASLTREPKKLATGQASGCFSQRGKDSNL